MKLLLISTDKKVFEEGSAVRKRMVEYGSLFEEFHIIVFSTGSYEKEQISNNVFLYPTNSVSRFFYIWDAYRLGKKIGSKVGKKEDGIDIVSAQDPFETGKSAWLISKKIKAKLHLQVHTDFASPYFLRGNSLNLGRVMIASVLIPRSRGVRVVSDRISKSIQKIWKGKSRPQSPFTLPYLLPIFTDFEKIENFFPKIDLHKKYGDDKKIFLSVGRLEKEKNFEYLIKIFERFEGTERNSENFILVVLGEGRLDSKLKKAVKKAGLEEKVYFEGYKDDIISYYKTADFYIQTSWYEGYGLSLVEAAVCGLPVITTDVGIVSEILKDGESATVIPFYDREESAEKIEELLEDESLGRKLSENAQKAVLKTKISKEEYLQKFKESFQI